MARTSPTDAQIQAVKERLRSLTTKKADKPQQPAEKQNVPPIPVPTPSQPVVQPATQPPQQYSYEVVKPQSVPSVAQSQQLPQLPQLPQQPNQPVAWNEAEEGDYDDDEEEYDEDEEASEQTEEQPKISEDDLARIRQLEAEMSRLERNGAYRAEVLYQLLQLNTAMNRLNISIERIANAQEFRARRRANEKRR